MFLLDETNSQARQFFQSDLFLEESLPDDVVVPKRDHVLATVVQDVLGLVLGLETGVAGAGGTAGWGSGGVGVGVGAAGVADAGLGEGTLPAGTGSDKDLLVAELGVGGRGEVGCLVLVWGDELCDEEGLDVAKGLEAGPECVERGGDEGGGRRREVVVVVVVVGVVEGDAAGAVAGVRGGVGSCRGERVEDETDGADNVELDDGAPEDAFFAKSRGRVQALELWARVRRANRKRDRTHV